MAYIGRQLARGENKLFDDISSSFNGSTTVFNLTVSSVATSTATPFQLFVSLGGVMQKPNTDFTTAGNQITFTTAPAAGLSCWIMMQGDTIDQAAIPDASVTPSKISGSNFAFSGDLRLKDADGSHYVGFASPSTVASNKVWTLPAADGSANQVLRTNGSGILSWATDSTVTEGTAVLSTGESSTNKYLRTDGDGTCSWQTIDTSTYMLLTGGTFTGDVTFDGATAGYDIVWDKSDNALEWADNAKAKFGTGGDLEIFHNASNSVINDAGTGDLLLQVGGSTKATVSSTGFDITGALTVSTNATITGNLTVSGTTTTINTQTLDVEDKNVVIGKVSSPSDTTADGGGWTLKGATDKTFNWVNATDAWTSSEHIHLIDNKKLFVGGASGTTDGLEIVHNASDSILNDTGTGALKLQLGGSTKLEITSGGIDVTGAITVGGTALSTAPTITAVAEGALVATKGVLIQTNGKVKSVSSTFPPLSACTTGGGVNGVGSNRWATSTNAGTNRMFSIFKDETNNVAMYNVTRAALDSGSGMTNLSGNTQFTLPTNTYNYYYRNSAYLGNNKVAVIMRTADGTMSASIVELAADGTSITQGSWLTLDSGSASNSKMFCAVSYDTDTSRILFVWSTGTSGAERGRFRSASFSGTTITLLGSNTYFNNAGGNEIGNIEAVYDTTANKHIIGFVYEANGNRPYCFSVTTSGSTTTAGSLEELDTTSMRSGLQEQFAMYFDENSSRTVMCHQNNNANEVRGYMASCNSGTGAMTQHGTYTTVTTSTNGAGERGICGCYEPGISKAVIGYAQSGNNWAINRMLTTSSSSNSITLGNEANTRTNTSHEIQHTMARFNDTYFRLAHGVRQYNASAQSNRTYFLQLLQTVQESTNNNVGKMIGFPDQSYSDGQTATIKVPGNTVTGLSGLTPGDLYYVSNNGTIGNQGSPAVIAGRAISSSSILIREPS
jgi:hypothetical protein